MNPNGLSPYSGGSYGGYGAHRYPASFNARRDSPNPFTIGSGPGSQREGDIYSSGSDGTNDLAWRDSANGSINYGYGGDGRRGEDPYSSVSDGINVVTPSGSSDGSIDYEHGGSMGLVLVAIPLLVQASRHF